MIMNLKDGQILKISYNKDQVTRGCPTCGYGAKYISWAIIKMTNYVVKFSDDSFNVDGDKGFSDFDLIMLFADITKEFTQKDFIFHVINYVNEFEGFLINITKNEYDGTIDWTIDRGYL